MEWGDDGKSQPMLVMQQNQGRDVGGAVMRSFMSLALLTVMLLAFGAAIAAWNKKSQLDTLLEQELRRTSADAAAVVTYRDELAAVREEIGVDLTPRPAPETPAWQQRIDLLVMHNNDLRWANEQLRLGEQQAKQAQSARRNPPEPGNIRAP